MNVILPLAFAAVVCPAFDSFLAWVGGVIGRWLGFRELPFAGRWCLVASVSVLMDLAQRDWYGLFGDGITVILAWWLWHRGRRGKDRRGRQATAVARARLEAMVRELRDRYQPRWQPA